jgi:hypothetical protein
VAASDTPRLVQRRLCVGFFRKPNLLGLRRRAQAAPAGVTARI